MSTTELNHDDFLKLTAENDKEVQLNLSVYRGGTAFTVFRKGNKPLRVGLDRVKLFKLAEMVNQAIAGSPNLKAAMNTSTFDPDSKKWTLANTVTIGKDDKNLIYIGITALSGSVSYKFIVKSPISWDMSDPMDDVARSHIASKALVEKLKFDIPMAMVVTKFKREAQAGGSGQRSNPTTQHDDGIF